MGTMRKRLSALGLAGLLLLAQPGIVPRALAEEPSLEDQLETLQQEAEEQQRITEHIEEQIVNVAADLHELEEQEADAAANYRKLKNDLDETEGKIDKNQQLLDETEGKLQERETVLKKRVRDIYMHGRISYIDVLFGAQDFKDMMTRMDLLSRVIKADLELVNGIRADREVVVKARTELEKDRAVQADLADRARLKKIELINKRTKKDELLARMELDKENSQALYDEKIAASQEIQELIRRRIAEAEARAVNEDGGSYTENTTAGYAGGVVAGGSGQMIWPISGEITSEYGWRTHPIYGDARYHSGLDIGGDYGQPILAAAAGTVIHSGWISGYGNTVIIDHGGGVSSLYGHNEDLAVSEGQHVSQGQVIAFCGSTGNSTGPHCHFEVREGGEPVSPYGYL